VLDHDQRLAFVTLRISATALSVSLWLMPAVGSSSRMVSAPPAMVMPISSAAARHRTAGRLKIAPVAKLQPLQQLIGRAFSSFCCPSRCQNE
jgi:hypothetical protein